MGQIPASRSSHLKAPGMSRTMTIREDKGIYSLSSTCVQIPSNVDLELHHPKPTSLQTEPPCQRTFLPSRFTHQWNHTISKLEGNVRAFQSNRGISQIGEIAPERQTVLAKVTQQAGGPEFLTAASSYTLDSTCLSWKSILPCSSGHLPFQVLTLSQRPELKKGAGGSKPPHA